MLGEQARPAREEDNAPWRSLPVVAAGQGFDFLAGCRVLDLTTSIAGPYATMLLADFGAEVIKIERPAGDDARHWGPPFLEGEALWFTAVNRNKKSVVLDMRSPGGRAHFEGLLDGADVFISNQPPDIQQKLGLDHATLSARRSSLIHVSITGFGLTGARAGLTSYDLIAEGYSGIMDITGAPESTPQKIGAPAADMLAGQDAAMATMAAYLGRQKTGRGACIDISLLESMTRFLSCRIASYLGSGEVPVRSGGTDSVIAIYQSFDTADKPLNLGLGSDAIWQRFWTLVGEPDYAARPEFANNLLRRENRAAIVARIQSVLRRHKRAEWLDLLALARVPAGPINSIDEVAQDAALQERGLFFTLRDDERLVPQIGLGIRIDNQTARPRGAPPKLGQHTAEILSNLPRR